MKNVILTCLTFCMSLKSQLIFLFTLLALYAPQLLAGSLLQTTREKELIQKLTLNPQSSLDRYEYALLLYQREKWSESLQQIKYVIQLNKNNLTANQLAKSLQKILQLQNPHEQRILAEEQQKELLAMAVQSLKNASYELKSSLINIKK